MPKLSNVLKDIQLKQWIKDGKPLVKADGGSLYFTLSKAGTASWILRVSKGGGKRDELTLGNYPDIGLSEARRLASIHRAEIDQGKNPAKEKAARKKAAANPVWTIKALAEDYKVKRLLPSEFSDVTIYIRNRDLNKVIIPRIGSMPVADVTGKDIVKMLRDAKRTWTISKQVLTTASKLFEHAAGLHLVHINPCVGISLTSLFGPRPPVRERVMLQEPDLRTLLANIDTLGTENSLALRLLLATCVRGSELVKAQWADVDLENMTWYVPRGNTKMRKGFYVPIAPSAAEWFRKLKDIAGNSPFVLPARDSRRAGKHISGNTVWAAIDRAFNTGRLKVTKFTPHDARSTAKGHMMNMGIPDYVSELALNHVVQGMQAIYDVRTEIPEKRDALNRWADYLMTLAPVKSLDNSEQHITTNQHTYTEQSVC